ncbi:hypothetical protein ACJ5H2_20330 [Nocardioides sp. R1-1]|uniref:hypothetical protein n=1 Tax=Nocardioides sp. R1-1 TaxID=3383502 RepID=UPI0038D18AF5
MHRPLTRALVLLLLGALVAVTVFVVVTRRSAPEPYQSAVVPSPAPSSSAPAAPLPAGRRTWRAAGEAYAAALTDRSGGLDRWLARLRPLLTEELWTSYRDTRLSRLPQGRLVRLDLERRAPGAGGAPPSVHAVIHWDEGTAADVYLHKLAGRWLVAHAGQVVDRPSEGAGTGSDAP